VKLLKGKHLRPDLPVADQPSFLMVHSVEGRPASVKAVGKRCKECGSFGSVIAMHAIPPAMTEDRASARMLA
jgi:hypothetical protein